LELVLFKTGFRLSESRPISKEFVLYIQPNQQTQTYPLQGLIIFKSKDEGKKHQLSASQKATVQHFPHKLLI